MADWQSVLRRAQEEVVDRDRLSVALRSIWPDVQIVSAEALLGGLGSVLHRLVVHGAPVRTLVLRQLLREFGDDAETLRRELVAHRELAARGVPAPVAYWADPDGELLGRPAAVLADVDGRLITPALADAAAQRAFAAVFASLAAVAADDLSRLDVLGDVDAHADRFGAPAAESELVDASLVQAHIDEHRRWFVPRRQVVHCDLHGGNVLWDGTTVTGLLDWPGLAVGVAACDEAYAWLDTSLALGPAAAASLQTEIDEARVGPAPQAGEVVLWRAVALRRALPSPGPWGEAYRAAGVDITDEQVAERFVDLVAHHCQGN